MKKYCIYRVSPHAYIHVRAVDEVIHSLVYGFKKLGISVPVVYEIKDIKDTILIVLLPQLLSQRQIQQLPDDAVLFNLEQLHKDSPFFTKRYRELLCSFQVWDYNDQNIQTLHVLGATNVKKCGIGYTPELSCIPEQEKDIDVFFYGSLNNRRSLILNQMIAQDIQVVHGFGIYGKERDAYIARAKVVLNIHMYASQMFEIVRVSYLLANKVCVLTETSYDQTDYLRGGLVEAHYSTLAQRCKELLQNAEERQKVSSKGFNVFSKLKQEKFLKHLVM